jgi:DNA modification methylase
VMAARKLGMETVPCIRLGHLSPAQVRAYVIADNKLALNAGWDEAMLKAELDILKEDGFDLDLTGFTESEIAALLGDEGDSASETSEKDEDAIPEVAEICVTASGNVWKLGRHRLICGDSTQSSQVEKLIGNASVDAIVTDPPYCSGGFQESGRSAGSIGTRYKGEIANDKLSTRGYMALMKNVLGLVKSPVLYAFTDWRMWNTLYDISESSGFGVRNMIVWNKGTPGMGMGWRAQHEICLFGVRQTVKFDPHKAQGNVITCTRSGNEFHPTQKPVELMEKILEVTETAKVIYDPFGGSGTTLIACEKLGRSALLCELSPDYCDVIVQRWENLTGQDAISEETGLTFKETKAKLESK